MTLDGVIYASFGLNLIQLSLWLRERRLRISEKEKFALYIKNYDKRLDKLEKKSSKK